MKKYSWQWYLKNAIENEQKSVERHIEQHRFFQEHKIFNLLTQAFPEGTWSYSYNYDFNLPMRFALIDEVKLFMREQFPDAKLNDDRQYVWEESAGRFVKYRYDGNAIEFTFRTTRNGSTCILNKIGEETKVVPIYEIVCSEAAANEFTMKDEIYDT